MTFKELRELQKVAATSHVGPGTYDRPESKMNKITIGKRYDTKYDSNLGPGYYDTDRGHYVTSHTSARYKMLGKSRTTNSRNYS